MSGSQDLYETDSVPFLQLVLSGNMTLGYTRDENVRLFCQDLKNYAAGKPLQGYVDRKRGY